METNKNTKKHKFFTSSLKVLIKQKNFLQAQARRKKERVKIENISYEKENIITVRREN